MTPSRPFDLATLGSAAPVWGGAARAQLDALIDSGDEPRRAIITGPAGSGKTLLLRHARRRLTDRGVTSALLRANSDPAELDGADVLFVDDAHRLDERRLGSLIDWLADPSAQIVVASRPWPRTAVMRQLADTIERAHPAVVLGHLSHHDLADLPGLGDACVEAILALTAGTPWLVAEAIRVHDTGCDGSGDHRHITGDLQDVIAHRLAGIDEAVAEAVVAVSLSPSSAATASEELLFAGFSEGMLQRNGRPVPLVIDAVRATLPIARIVDLYVASTPTASDLEDGIVDGISDDRIAAMLLRQGDASLSRDAAAAAELFRRAGRAGADPLSVRIREASAAWVAGDIDTAAALLEGIDLGTAHPDRDRAIDLSASIWAARGDFESAAAVYRASGRLGSDSAARAATVALAAGDPVALDDAKKVHDGAPAMPSTLSVSLGLVARGVQESTTGSAQYALVDLVRAAEVYTASGTAAPIGELPAVIATLMALNIGELDVAHSVIADAVARGHGGPWARPRLLLWSSWVSLQCEHRADAEAALAQALATPRPLSPRDATLASALSVAIARRYGDLGELTAQWRRARSNVMRSQFDVLSILPLGEFVLAAVRVGDEARMDPHFERALENVARLSKGSVWGVPLHWTGIQRGILRGQPDDLRPHARALVEAAGTNPLAAQMAQAGRVWTAVLAGKVDPDVVEAAALGLASVGLAWDGARLAGHAAGRTDDKRAISRLLACARQLHPREDPRAASAPAESEEQTVSTPPATPGASLSPREREVAELVLQGKTYVEIGESIFISPRTAEHHIARIRRRLGATTRSDLIAKLRAALTAEDSSARARVSA